MQKLATVATLCLFIIVAILGKLVWDLQQHNRILESRIQALEHRAAREDMMLTGFWEKFRELEEKIRKMKSGWLKLVLDFGIIWDKVWETERYDPSGPLPQIPEYDRQDQEVSRFRLLKGYLVV